MAKKQRLQIPLAVHWTTSQEGLPPTADCSDSHAPKLSILEASVGHAPLLLAFTDSPQRVLLVPEIAGKDRKKAKSCCDKQCSKCQIPLRSSATIGYFAVRRLRKALKKDKWCKNFFGPHTEAALEELSIHVYAPALKSQMEAEVRCALAI